MLLSVVCITAASCGNGIFISLLFKKPSTADVLLTASVIPLDSASRKAVPASDWVTVVVGLVVLVFVGVLSEGVVVVAPPRPTAVPEDCPVLVEGVDVGWLIAVLPLEVADDFDVLITVFLALVLLVLVTVLAGVVVVFVAGVGLVV